MSVARSATRCVFCSFRQSLGAPEIARRSLHNTPARKLKAKAGSQVPSRFKGGDEVIRDGSEDDVPPEKQINIPKEGRKSLRLPIPDDKFTPKQREAILAAQNLIPEDAFESGNNPQRVDPWAVDYYDSLEQVHPVLDKPVLSPWENFDDNSRLKTESELEDDLFRLIETAPRSAEDTEQGQLDRMDFFDNFDRDLRLTVGSEAHERRPRTALAPSIPSDPKPVAAPADTKGGKEHKPRENFKRPQEEASLALVRLMQMTGYSREEIAKLRVKSVISHRVVNQTRLGKIEKMYFLTVAGNGNGLLGIGEGKSEEPEEARLQSQYRAIRSMTPILRYENRTIYGDVKGKVSATELELMARPPGFGLRCQQYIWEMCKCAGIHDLSARVTRARNPMNTVKAAYEAMMKQKHPDDIARARGKKMVDVRRVYYAGQV